MGSRWKTGSTLEDQVAVDFGTIWVWRSFIFSSAWGCIAPWRPASHFGGHVSAPTWKVEVAVTWRTFAQIYLMHQFLDWEALLMITHALVTASWLQQCALPGAAPEDFLETTVSPENSGTNSYGYKVIMRLLQNAYATLLLYNLYWLPEGSQVQYKVLVVTYNVSWLSFVAFKCVHYLTE